MKKEIKDEARLLARVSALCSFQFLTLIVGWKEGHKYPVPLIPWGEEDQWEHYLTQVHLE